MRRATRGFALLTVLVTAAILAAAGAETRAAVIFYGNNAQFGSAATNPSSAQGFTDLEARWEALGVPTTITNTFSPAGNSIFYATAPTTAFNAAQVTQLQAFLAAGGLFIISHDGGVVPAMNQALADLGSSMSFGALQGGGFVSAPIVNFTDPLTQGFNPGDALTPFSPGQITGSGTTLATYNGLPIVMVESVGGGRILAVADFDLLNNVTDDFLTGAQAQHNHLFQDNIARSVASTTVPEPATLAHAVSAAVTLGLWGVNRRRRKLSQNPKAAF